MVTVSQAVARSHQDHRSNDGKLTKITPFAIVANPETSTSDTASADQQTWQFPVSRLKLSNFVTIGVNGGFYLHLLVFPFIY